MTAMSSASRPETTAAGAPTTLLVRTRPVEQSVDLLSRIPEAVSAAWLRHGQGMIALGTAWSVRTSGPDRFARASSAFRAVAARAVVDDAVRSRASGVIALGSFSYAASSPRDSVLMVPRAVLGLQDGEAFFTTIHLQGERPPEETWEELFPPREPPAPPEQPTGIDPAHTPREYQALVQRALEQIRAGRAQKVVLSEATAVSTPAPVSRAALLSRLARAYPSTWVYHLADVIGASPEMLAQTEDGELFSRVLAGTRAVADSGELDEVDRRAFRADPKERSEHAFAVDSVLDRLRGLAEHVDSSPEPFVLRLPGMEHLASDITGRLPAGATSLDLAARLHPSAAVSGTPREAADEVIAELESADRGGYAAPVGWMDAHGDGQWAIALRMAHLVDARTAVLQAGGGLVAASDPVSEHAEVLTKMRPVLRALGGG